MGLAVIQTTLIVVALFVMATQVIALLNGSRQVRDPKVSSPRARALKVSLALASLASSTVGFSFWVLGRALWPQLILVAGVFALALTLLMSPTDRQLNTIQHRALARVALLAIITIQIGLSAALEGIT